MKERLEHDETRGSFEPHFEPEGLALFRRSLEGARCYAEYGCGGSTIVAVEAGVPAVYSVDTDKAWLAGVDRALRGATARIQLMHLDLGPVGNWGMPATLDRAQQFHRYAHAPWDAAAAANDAPDVVLVDGRFRVASFLYSLAAAPDGATILFDDYATRNAYHVVEAFCKPVEFAGRMARFQRQAPTDLPALLRVFAKHTLIAS